MKSEKILRTVCDVLNVDIKDVLQYSNVKGARNANLVQARNLFMWFAREYNIGTLQVIGGYVNRDHSTCINAFRVIQNDNKYNTSRLRLFLEVKRRLANDETDIEELNYDFGYDYPGAEISAETLSYQSPR